MQLYLAGEYYKNMGNAVKQIVWGVAICDTPFLYLATKWGEARNLT